MALYIKYGAFLCPPGWFGNDAGCLKLCIFTFGYLKTRGYTVEFDRNLCTIYKRSAEWIISK